MENAAKLAKQLLIHTLTQALGLIEKPNISINLCVSPTPDADDWQEFRAHLESSNPLAHQIIWTAQSSGDLGARLTHASQFAIKNNTAPIFIGSDCPALTTEKLAHAIHQLNTHDAVIVPATDGGYVLFGFHQFDASLFSNIAWSTETVAQTTLERIHALGWSISQLASEHDIDYPKDLIHLPATINRPN